MAKDLNKVMITGRLGADPELRFTPQGNAVCTFRVASNHKVRDKPEETEWFQVLAWDKLGEICNQYLTKGARVYVEGRLQTRKWEDREGTTRYTTEVIASEMIILESRATGAPVEPEPEPEAAPPPSAPGVKPRKQAVVREPGRPAFEEEDLPL